MCARCRPPRPPLASCSTWPTAAAAAASDLLLAGARTARTSVLTKTTVTDMVTEMDHASEALVREHLLGARPDDGFLGEETGPDRRHQRRALGRRSARRHDELPLRLPRLERVDRRRGRATAPSPPSSSTPCSATPSAPCEAAAPTATARRSPARTRPSSPRRSARRASPTTPPAAAPRPPCSSTSSTGVRDIRRGGAAAVDLCSVACGRVDAYWERGLGPWDLAAGSLIAREAGATRRRRRRPRVHPRRPSVPLRPAPGPSGARPGPPA